MADPHALYEKDGPVAIVTMNRPEAHNAITPEMLVLMADAWQDVSDDKAIRAVILTGAGDKAFCAGADLERLVGLTQGRVPPESVYDHRILEDFSLIYKGLLKNFTVYKPIIAAVKGWCVAGGTEILQATDIRIAAEDAEFGIAEAKWGLFPMGGSTVRLARQIPYCQAMEILLTGERLSARKALEIGLINRIVPAGEVMSEARRYAEIIAANGPLAVQSIKRSVLETAGLSYADALRKEDEFGIPVNTSKDAREGSKAFKEKRKPVFTMQ